MGPGGIWEMPPGRSGRDSLTIDPAKNGGERGRGVREGGGRRYEHRGALHPGARRQRHSTPTPFTLTGPIIPPAGVWGKPLHQPAHANNFDWLSVDTDRNMPMASNGARARASPIHAKEQHIMSTGIYKNSVEHKYSYCAQMYELPAYGWSSIKDHVGVWFINPSYEYLGGGPTRIDLVCHLGATMLDYWTSGHYGGGAECNVPANEVWSKVVGPIFVYCNALQSAQDHHPSRAGHPGRHRRAIRPCQPHGPPTPTPCFNDALAQAKTIEPQWPFNWVQSPEYALKDGRATSRARSCSTTRRPRRPSCPI